MIVYQSRFLTRGEVWFNNHRTSAQVDWILYHQRSQPLPKATWRPFYTRVIELPQTPDTLLSQMDGFTAADIRKAQKKDRTTCRLLESSKTVWHEFYDFYDRFALRKKLPPADRHWLSRTAEAAKLDLWAADSHEGQRLAYHAFYRDQKRVRSMHAASLHAETAGKEGQRKIGRANRLLIWETMLFYREHGVETFDLGGWYNGTTDQALLGINKFKAGLGGKVICEYEGEQLLTFKAWSAVHTARLMEKFKQWRSTQKQPMSANSCSPAGDSRVIQPPCPCTPPQNSTA